MYTPKQHIEDIINEFSTLAKKKYNKGQKEHGGKLWRKPVVNEVMSEAIDFIIYVSTMLKQIETAKTYLKEFLDEGIQINSSSDKVLYAFNTLEYGNPEGKNEYGD